MPRAHFLLLPSCTNHLLDKDNIIIDAKSGLSGAGKSLTLASHFVNVNENFTMYKANHHQHIPEITQQLQQWQSDIAHIQFTTSLLPINRGIFVSAYVKINDDSQAEKFRNYTLQRMQISNLYVSCPKINYQASNRLSVLTLLISD